MTEALQPAAPSGDDDLDLVALTPAHLEATQKHLVGWCERKVAQVRLELKDLEEHALIATSNGWNLRGLNASIRRTEKRLVYYDKMRRAVEEGYLMVPNFPITLLAVRVARTAPRFTKASNEWSHKLEARAELLPEGEGRYVDNQMIHEELVERDGDKDRTVYVPTEYDGPDFPFELVKPAVMEATDRAMRLRVFDEIGMVANVPGSGRDPIMVGRLLDPRGNGRCTTFFIAWWLNTRAL